MLSGILCGPRMLGADVRCELLVALLSEIRLHLLNGIANDR